MRCHDEWRDEETLRRRVLAVETERNAGRRCICWQFTSHDARHKLERLYPVKEAQQLESTRTGTTCADNQFLPVQ